MTWPVDHGVTQRAVGAAHEIGVVGMLLPRPESSLGSVPVHEALKQSGLNVRHLSSLYFCQNDAMMHKITIF